ncbi:CK001 protein, partial [Amia calva]|nr:CK001 protein [Amia calva]
MAHAPFSTLRASGHGEVWCDYEEDAKLRQYGWRCTTSEDAYSRATLLGNWAEERHDLGALAQRRPLPSQFAHYFDTTYASTFNTSWQSPTCPPGLKREAHVFPGHQPELDPPHTKLVPGSCYRVDFRDPGQGETQHGPGGGREMHSHTEAGRGGRSPAQHH